MPLLAVPACSSSSGSLARVGVASPHQEAVGGSAVALRYREVGAIKVLRLDAAGQPEPGVTVSFSISGDSGGSALGAGRALTGSDGIASVPLSGGIQDATFRVVASSTGAEELAFDVTVSRYPFVDLAVRLSYPGRGSEQVTTVRALVYADRGCSALPASRTEPADYARMNYAPTPSATLEFLNLASHNYALVGRAEDNEGHVIARGCVDLLESQLTGGRIEVPVPMVSVVAVLADAYELSSTLDLSSLLASADSPIAAWDRLGACPVGFAQALLDAMLDGIDPGPVRAAIEAARAPVDMTGCRPELVGGVPTLDARLYQMMWTQNGVEAQLPEVVAALQAIVREAKLTSRLALTPESDSRYLGSHALTRVAFHDVMAKHVVEYDPIAFGLPVISVDSLPIDFDGQTIVIPPHGVTVRMPWLWGHALEDLVLKPRALPTEMRPLVQGAVAAASIQGVNGQPNLAGCDAIEELLCKAAALKGPCAIAAVCGVAVDALGDSLAAPFVPAPGIDFIIEGHGVGVDSDGDLVVESIDSGVLDTVVAVSAMSEVKVPGSFTGTAARIP